MTQRVWAAICLALALVLASSDTLYAGSKPLMIAMILWRGETRAEAGFKDGLAEHGYSVQYTIMDAGQDKNELGRLLRSEMAPNIRNFDYVYTYGTTVSLAAKTIIDDRAPQIFNIVVAPVDVGLVQSMESSGGRISGSSNSIPLALQMETVLKVIQFKKLGLFFNPREKNAMAIRQQLQDVGKRYSFEVIDLRSPPAKDMLQENLQKLMDKSVDVDAIYLPADSFMVSNAQLLGSQLRAAKVKSIGSIQDFIDKGILIGVVPDYYELGKAAAEIIDRHQKGEKLQNIPVQTVKEPTLMINKTTAALLGITISEVMLKKAVVVE